MENLTTRPRHLLLILGDQLDRDAALLSSADPGRDLVWMAETQEEVSHVWCHKLRIAFFFSAMRHFREELKELGWQVLYHQMEREADSAANFADFLQRDLPRLNPEGVRVTLPGDWRVLEMLRKACRDSGLPLEIVADEHFLSTPASFQAWAQDRKSLVLEHFYRDLRRRLGFLLAADGEPEGGAWNFDCDNRKSFSREGPGMLPLPLAFAPDTLSREVLDLVAHRFGDNPGTLAGFELPVTRADSLAFLEDFVENRLDLFGPYEDAMWSGEAFLYHSRLSALLNVKLLNPRECLEKAVKAYSEKRARLASVEGFVRQILGWREFVRGIYWHYMPDYLEMNALAHQEELPPFFWNGQTRMTCVRESMKAVLKYGYTHHIQRLMVLGQFALLYGVDPAKFHGWHMAMYLDAIDWASLPNTLGMSQFGDGGIVGTKPYCASGNYINKMSNYCGSCPYAPQKASGEKACPFTTLYWDFLDRHRETLAENHRMGFQYRNLNNKDKSELREIRERARYLRDHIDRI
ncbi:MAG TPA: cryptochrome/photolyase family protein [Calditrichia bacterium]|nr:cryptochrome/photolyase family protein [Calditrichia bacterium]